MSDSIPPIQFPVIEMVAGDEMNLALVRAVLARRVPDADDFLATYDVNWKVGMRAVTAAGSQVMVASVVLLSAVPKPPKE